LSAGKVGFIDHVQVTVSGRLDRVSEENLAIASRLGRAPDLRSLPDWQSVVPAKYTRIGAGWPCFVCQLCARFAPEPGQGGAGLHQHERGWDVVREGAARQ
jgi:hypothetical protein